MIEETDEFELIDLEEEIEDFRVDKKKHKVCKICNLMYNKEIVERNVCRRCRRKGKWK